MKFTLQDYLHTHYNPSMETTPDPSSETLAAEQTEPDATAALAHDIRVLTGALRRRLRDATTDTSLSWSHLVVLGQLDREGPSTVTRLAMLEYMRPQSMGALIATLAKNGFVTGEPDPNDGRQTLWSLTDKGATTIFNSRTLREDWLIRSLQTRFSADEREVVQKAVHLLLHLAES